MQFLPLALSIALVGPVAGPSTLLVTPGTDDTLGHRMTASPAEPGPPASSSAPTSPRAGVAANPAAGATWSAPVGPLDVVRPFDAPAQDWLPGHRGVDLRAPAGSPVFAPAPGRIAFTGMVAGRPVVSIDHVDPADPEGVVRTTYEPVRASVRRGEQVERGDVIGVVADGRHCSGGCLHWGARRGESYVDPMSFLHGRIRLWPPRQPTG